MAEEHERAFMVFGLDDQGDIHLFATNVLDRAEDTLASSDRIWIRLKLTGLSEASPNDGRCPCGRAYLHLHPRARVGRQWPDLVRRGAECPIGGDRGARNGWHLPTWASVPPGIRHGGTGPACQAPWGLHWTLAGRARPCARPPGAPMQLHGLRRRVSHGGMVRGSPAW